MSSKRTVLYLSRADVENVDVPMGRILEVVESALVEKAHGRVYMPPKTWIEPNPSRWFAAQTSVAPSLGFASMKWQSGSSANRAAGLPYITGMMFLNDLQSGLVAAVMDSTWLTQQRTAAASAIAAKYLATPRASSWAILGCGVQARSHLKAFQIVLKDLRDVVAFDIDPAAARAFADEVEMAGLRARIVDSPRAALDGTDIVVTSGPIARDQSRSLKSNWLKPGALAITLDYDCYWSAAAFAAADRFFTDDIGQIEHIKAEGYFVECPRPHGEIGSIAAGLCTGRDDGAQTIIVANLGIAVEDVATAAAIYERARTKHLGVELPY